MSLFQSFLLALKSLATGKMRALLTMLGIIIGVAAVIIIVSLGQGMQKTMNDAISSLGTNLVNVTIMGRGSSRTVTEKDFYKFRDENKALIAAMSPTITLQVSAKSGAEDLSSTVTGVGEEYDTIKSYNINEGRFLQYIDMADRKKVCVVGSYLAKEILGGRPIGKTLNLNGYHYTVVGTIEELADSTEGSTDDMILVPYTCAAGLSGGRNMATYTFAAKDSAAAYELETRVSTFLYQIFEDEDAYDIMNMASMMDEINNVSNTMVIFLAAIAAISLLVGGIGIMNIMLVSVTERTREIGIRKSVGAKPLDIMSQFIIEAGTTSGLGGVIGIVIGATLSSAIGNAIGMESPASTEAILLAFGVSVFIGVLFGFLPARRAARLNPIDALHYD